MRASYAVTIGLSATVALASGAAVLAIAGTLTPIHVAATALPLAVLGFAGFGLTHGRRSEDHRALLQYITAADGGEQPQLNPDLADIGAAAFKVMAELRAQLKSQGDKLVSTELRASEASQRLTQKETELARALSQLEILQNTSAEAFRIVENLAYSAQQLGSQSEVVAEAMNTQKERIRETATAMEEMNSTVLEVAGSAERAAQGTDASRGKAVEGQGVVDRSMQAIRRVEGVSRELERSMNSLGEKARNIGEVMDVITEIADQTNLLALNAAIEAARAGEAGRGFAVVADEVRKLAEKTMTATGEVGQSIQAIQDAVQSNVASMQAAAQAVDEAANLAANSGAALREIVSFAESNSDQVRSIATASEEQSAVSEEINRSVSEINTLADRTTGEMTSSIATVKELLSLAEKLHSIFESFSGTNDTKLAASSGSMLGALPKLMLDFVAQRYGDSVRQAMLKEMGDPVFMVQKSYPDAVLRQMAEITARLTGHTEREIFYELGFYTPGEFARLYKKYFKATNLKEFLLSMNDVHAQVTRDMPGAIPPRFEFKDAGTELTITYYSARGLFDYFEGSLKGTAAHFNQQIDLRIHRINDTTAQAVIRFL